MTPANVFISYKSEEFATADWVRQTLEYHGISCWMAPSSIPGGSNYAKEIPQAIRNCKVFVLILSAQSQLSQWVPKEVDQAINMNKTIMPFMLENCELRDDFNFYLSNVQRYAAYENKSRAMEKMLREIRAILDADESAAPETVSSPQQPSGPASQMTDHRAADPASQTADHRPADPAPQTADHRTTNSAPQTTDLQSANSAPQAADHTAKSEAPMTSSAAEPETSKASAPNKKEKFRKKRKESRAATPSTGKKRHGLKKILAVLAILILAVAGGSVIYQQLTQVTIAGKTFQRTATSLTLSDVTLSAADVQAVSKFKKLQTVRLQGCSLETEDLTPLLSESLINLELSDCNLSDAQIASLNLEGTSVATLHLGGNPNLKSLDLLTPVTAKLQVLDVNNTSVPDLTVLAECTKLYRLNISHTNIRDLSALGSLENITELNTAGNELSSLAGLEHALILSNLYAADNNLTELSGLTNTTMLERVDLSNNQLTEIDILKKSADTIKRLYLGGNQLTDGTVFAGFPNLETLHLDGNPISSLAGLESCANLKVCSAAGTGLQDASPLKSLTALTYLNLADTQLQEVDLPNSTENMVLELSRTPLTKLTLTTGGKYRYIGLAGTSCDVSTLSHTTVTYLVLPYAPTLDLPALKETVGVTIHLADCPLDQQVAVKDILGSEAAFVTAEEADTIAEEYARKNLPS